MTKVEKSKKKSKRGRLPVPLAPPTMRSRKRARKVTTLFHKYTHERDRAIARGDLEKVAEASQQIEKIGGREEYQRASQLSTSFHSTSKWVLGVLGQKGWLAGVPKSSDDIFPGTDGSKSDMNNGKASSKKGKAKKIHRRKVRLLEVGAINTELLDAAAKRRRVMVSRSDKIPEIGAQESDMGKSPIGSHACTEGNMGALFEDQPVHCLEVRSIDLHSSCEGIEEADFLQVPLIHQDARKRYDVVVCSMVINCVSSPEDRGRMLTLLYHQLRPGGLCFLTLPKLCLTQSKYVTRDLFETMLTRDGRGVGFEIAGKKESPKVAFFVLTKPDAGICDQNEGCVVNPKWTKVVKIKKAKKFRNDF
eukprot:CAMPEP_0113530830 /NCGR_PEP_ID=MMETSP0015_2-20120614/3165_1 /TAXON_ID=2838 /ORGANISM="Odontella" /LENGTH=361 /DNA_ID=CAMNT_0000429611 /DNA_START=77 /DNA_END=1159 /DNA_ORIENTATION=- /assembly_acc=CAM_ASM_000160